MATVTSNEIDGARSRGEEESTGSSGEDSTIGDNSSEDSTGSGQDRERSVQGDHRSEDSSEGNDEEVYKRWLIEEVYERPLLWAAAHRYYDKRRKDKMWKEIASKLHEYFIRLPAKERKENEVEKARKCWKNLKDCFSRYVAKREKGEKSTQYRYYKQLKFLMKTVKITKHKTAYLKKPKRNDIDAKKSIPSTSGSKRKSRSRIRRSQPSKRSRQESAGSSSSTRAELRQYKAQLRQDSAQLRQPSNDLGSRQKLADASTRGADASAQDTGTVTRDVGISTEYYCKDASTSTEDNHTDASAQDTGTLTRDVGISTEDNRTGAGTSVKGDNTSTRDAAGARTRSTGTSTGEPLSHSGNNPARSYIATHEELPGAGSNRELAVPRRVQPPAEIGQQHKMASPLEACMLEMLRERREDEYDEDKCFAKHIVGLLKELPPDHKHFAKISLLDAVKNARYWVPDASVDLPVPDHHQPQDDTYSSVCDAPSQEHDQRSANTSPSRSGSDEEQALGPRK